MRTMSQFQRRIVNARRLTGRDWTDAKRLRIGLLKGSERRERRSTERSIQRNSWLMATTHRFRYFVTFRFIVVTFIFLSPYYYMHLSCLKPAVSHDPTRETLPSLFQLLRLPLFSYFSDAAVVFYSLFWHGKTFPSMKKRMCHYYPIWPLCSNAAF